MLSTCTALFFFFLFLFFYLEGRRFAGLFAAAVPRLAVARSGVRLRLRLGGGALRRLRPRPGGIPLDIG